MKENTYGERRIQISADQVEIYTTHLVKILPLPENIMFYRRRKDILKESLYGSIKSKNVQEIRTSVLMLYIIKAVSTTQHVDYMERGNMYYLP